MDILLPSKTIIFILLFLFLYLYNPLKPDNVKNISRLSSLRKGKFYIKECLKGTLINTNYKKKYSEPKISAVIPVYNCQDMIKAAIRSIQNQDMSKIEIILVNDLSKDNSSKIIEELSLEDPRIKIINNQKNMGTLFSRNIGILNSNGKYIMNLDNDDLFIDKDVFNTVYDEAEEGNYDILGFAAMDIPNYNPLISQMSHDYFHNHKDGLFITQPELNYFPFTRKNKYRPNDYHVWGRLVKTDLYKKAINNLGITAIGKDRKTQFLSWAEDSSMSVVLFYYAESYKYIQKYGIFHYISKKTASFTRLYSEKFFSEIFFLDIMYDFTHNSSIAKKYVVEKAKEMRYDDYYNLNNEKNIIYFKAVLQKIFNCPIVTQKDKVSLMKLYKNLLNKDN